MPALLVIRATGPKAGRVSAILDRDADPGAAVRANTNGQWAFVYVTGVNPNDLDAYLAPEETDLPEALDSVPKNDRVKNEVIRARLDYVDLVELAGDLQQDETFSSYSDWNASTAFKINQVAMDARLKKERDK